MEQNAAALGGDVEARIRKIHARCKQELAELEFWPGYYDRRLSEFLTYLELLPRKQFEQVLEVGCGNGYYSAFLSCISEQVTATDLGNSSIPLHAQVLNQASKLNSHLGNANVRVQAASVEALPFADESFDLVFSSHVMVYPTQPRKAVLEVERVLRPGGYHFCVVPSRMTTVFQLFFFQHYVLKRGVHHLVTAPLAHLFSRSAPAPGAAAPVHDHPASTKLEALKHFPFPRTFGGHPHWKDEFRAYSAANWRKLLTDDGRIELVSQCTTQLNPLIPLIGEFNAAWAGRAHELTREFELKHGKGSLAQSLGTNSVVVTRKGLSG